MSLEFRQGGGCESSELYFRPETRVYGAAGGFSAKKERYPVSKHALTEYLRHQPRTNLERLVAKKGRGRGGGARNVVYANKDKMLSAMSQYLQHQPLSTIREEMRGRNLNAPPSPRLKSLHVRAQQHRSHIEEIARRILGAAPAREGEGRKRPDGGQRGSSGGGRREGKGRVEGRAAASYK
ncbi:hypothetical protein GUITHDRAFT_118644 [Guillardia theta CCMP2712]|uniref:Uncharacterized protein n=1 Tax=Guillardia theta (strain CCMP2712) TaxID=905079 RepID=L1IG11_GUITC|nr:hypothetical protein GUITHDRAFT_118644 [Guillardia theta CCMP2712]EKX35201.1 hypothetical protein GUITHDRAFT_118644 [Guillardia theta CCMP2712]|eukprot:XP_005822181.1 hypothetical protein GUITHDRAFT_118644 [Guillardia theta CCMP2712]